jgi:hypothetical protein
MIKLDRRWGRGVMIQHANAFVYIVPSNIGLEDDE